MISYLLGFLLALLVSALLTPLTKRLALQWHLVDEPSQAPERKIHARPIPLAGGSAIFCAFFLSLLILLVLKVVPSGIIHQQHFAGIFLASLVLMISGAVDDWSGLAPRTQFFWSLVASLIIVLSDIGIRELTNPFGGKISLVWMEWGSIAFPSDFITVIWLLATMYTTKLLDGLDGLVTGIGAIGGFTLFAVSLLPQLLQPQTALVALLFAGACVGFLPFNWHPARVFLGNGGSLLVGFLLGVLAIASGGKFITLLLLLAIPLFDLFWVVFRRVIMEHRSPFAADRKHFHHRLLDVGLSHRQAVASLLAVSAAAGIAAFALQTQYKIYALGIFLLVIVIAAAAVVRLGNARKAHVH